MNSMSVRWLGNFLKRTFYISLVISLSVFAWVRLIFYEVPFSLKEDSLTLCKVLLTGWLMVVIIKGLFYTIVGIGELIKQRSLRPLLERKWIALFLIAIVFSAFLVSCQAQVSAGIKKDLSTGLTASYKNIEPGKILLVMNNEVLNHTDIPIGESFWLVNENVQGLKEKNGKVSLGCSLTISDKKGKKLLEAADLFQNKDVFDKKEARYLKCIINTGKPMEWEENYNVVVTFWDKYGTGRIINKVTIRAIDIP